MSLAGALLLTLTLTTPAENRRPPDNTFLTYPEWFLVFSPAEYAAFIRHDRPSEFPFLGHIRQFWRGYEMVCDATRGRYPFNSEYHVMILVIGTSTTVEYAMRSAYAATVGRLAEMTRRGGATEEERLASRVAQEYVDFIRVRPWYEFDFAARLRQLWSGTSLWGRDPIRKWERKYALTTEYLIKAGYGWALGKASQTAYGAELTETAVIAVRNGREELLMLPRYEPFMNAATKLAKEGVEFREIAGNRDVILVSVIAAEGSTTPYRVLATEPILTRPGRERHLLEVKINTLSEALRTFSKPGFELEHVYDF